MAATAYLLQPDGTIPIAADTVAATDELHETCCNMLAESTDPNDQALAAFMLELGKLPILSLGRHLLKRQKCAKT